MEYATARLAACQSGDKRRTDRAVRVARQMARHPDGGTPAQTENWADLKATYHLFDEEDVTFSALAEPHWKQTRAAASGTVLLSATADLRWGDTMETDFGIHRQVAGLGPTGDGRGCGFMLHSSLMVAAESGEIIGLAAQVADPPWREIFYRRPVPKNERSCQKPQRARESEVWGRVIDQVGPPAAGVQYLHVLDRGADNLEVFCHAARQQGDCATRRGNRAMG